MVLPIKADNDPSIDPNKRQMIGDISPSRIERVRQKIRDRFARSESGKGRFEVLTTQGLTEEKKPAPARGKPDPKAPSTETQAEPPADEEGDASDQTNEETDN